MPRTRSLAWSELKIGVLTIVAIVIAAALIFSADRQPRVLLAALLAEDAVPECRRAERRVAGPGRRRGSRQRHGRSTFAGEQVDVVFEVNKELPALDHDRLGRAGSARSRCSARARWTSPPSSGGDADSRVGLRAAGQARRGAGGHHRPGEPGHRRS